MAKTTKKPAGRPAGSKSTSSQVVETVGAHCPACHSTECRVIRITAERELPGLSPAGKKRTHIIWRRVRCQCGQYFTTMTHENRTA